MRNLSFYVFGFPTSVQPFFWLMAAILGSLNLGPIDNMPIWFAQMAAFIAAVFLSILVHELGHAFVFRHLFHVPSTVTIHGFGGVTVPMYQPQRRQGFIGTASGAFLAAAGPLAGFLLAALFIGIIMLLPFKQNQNMMVDLYHQFMVWVIYISIVWGIFNLFPIYPMDGGHIAREIFSFFFKKNGINYSLIFSMIIAVFFAVVALRFNEMFIVFLFGYFAYQNYQELQFRSFRRW
jgi:Zn-dependent protease